MTEPTPVVFVIDDDPLVRALLRRQLNSAGFDTQTFPSAEAFLAQPRPDAPACAVVDVRMDGLSGLDLQHELGKAGDALPIIFITGQGDIPMTVQAMKAGAIDFFTKPFHDEVLLAAVRFAIGRNVQTRRRAAEVAEIRARADSLSPRQREVMALVVAGMPN